MVPGKLELWSFGDRDARGFRSLRKYLSRDWVRKAEAVERGSNRIAIAHVALDEFRPGIYPRWLSAAVRLRLEIIQPAHLPPFAHKKIDNMRAD